MATRKEQTSRIVLMDGTTLDIRMLDGITIDDILVQGMKAEGYRVITKKEVFPVIDRKTTDYLIRIGVITG
jgi:hypothetical protein